MSLAAVEKSLAAVEKKVGCEAHLQARLGPRNV